MLCSLNDEQLIAFEAVHDATQQEQKDSKDFFLDRPGGSGKTYSHEALISTIRGEGSFVAAVAFYFQPTLITIGGFISKRTNVVKSSFLVKRQNVADTLHFQRTSIKFFY